VLGLSAVLGPIAGGFIISADLVDLHWRPVFLINIVVGGAGLIAAVALVPREWPVSDERIDALGSGMLGLMMLALIYGLITGSTDAWTAAPIASLAAGAALFSAFVLQRYAASPLIRPTCC
jgi:MFS family permease